MNIFVYVYVYIYIYIYIHIHSYLYIHTRIDLLHAASDEVERFERKFVLAHFQSYTHSTSNINTYKSTLAACCEELRGAI